MNYTCVTECLLEQCRKAGILKNYSVLNPVSIRRLLRKSLCFLYCYMTFLFLSLALFCSIIELEKLLTMSDAEYKK